MFYREFEQQRELSVKGLHTLSGQRSYVPAETATATLEMTSEQLDKVCRFLKNMKIINFLLLCAYLLLSSIFWLFNHAS